MTITKNTVKNVLLAFVGIVALAATVSAIDNYKRAKVAEKLNDEYVQVNDSTRAQVARLEYENRSLRALQDAADDMGGELVSGVRINVPERVIEGGDSIPVTQDEQGLFSTAVLAEDFEGGNIEITATPYEDRLDGEPTRIAVDLTYKLTLDPFSPEVGFVRVDDRYFAVVSWAGQEFTTESAFYEEPKQPFASLLAGAELDMSPGGVGALLHGRAFVGIEKRLEDEWEFQIEAGGMVVPGDNGYSAAPYVGISGERHLPLKWPF